MEAIFTPSDEQFADPEFRQMVANSCADKLLADQANDLAKMGGRKFAIPIKMAVRISGWNEKWVRRNLAEFIIVAEGQQDCIELGDLENAMDKRKGGKA